MADEAWQLKATVGGGINVSAFCSEKEGVVRLTDDQFRDAQRRRPGIAQDSTIKMKCGTGTKYSTEKTGDTLMGVRHNGWWNNDLVLAQIDRWIPIFEE